MHTHDLKLDKKKICSILILSILPMCPRYIFWPTNCTFVFNQAIKSRYSWNVSIYRLAWGFGIEIRIPLRRFLVFKSNGLKNLFPMFPKKYFYILRFSNILNKIVVKISDKISEKIDFFHKFFQKILQNITTYPIKIV